MIANDTIKRKEMVTVSQEAFIANHQMNVIRSEMNKLKYAITQNADKRVTEGVRSSAEAAIALLFPELPDDRREELFSVKDIKTDQDCDAYIGRCAAYVAPFPQITEKELQKLFPKNKKLKLPDMSKLPLDKLSYLSWVDVGTGKLFIVYPMNGRLAGVESRFTVSNKHTVCAVCNSHKTPEQVGLVTAVCKPDRSQPAEYFKSVGNYMCLDSVECSKNVKDVSYLESFIREVLRETV